MSQSPGAVALFRHIALAVMCILASRVAVAADDASVTSSAPSSQSRDQELAIQLDSRSRILIRLCRPAADTPARLVVINHGSPPDSSDRPRMQIGRCSQEAAQWFLTRGYVVAFPLRRGYGATGGEWAEDYGRCEHADYFHAGLETARDIDAAVRALTALPFVRPDEVIIVGQSAGGWGTIAYASIAHPRVSRFIVMAGGRGGHVHDRLNKNCRPDRLADAAARYGASAKTPMLWVYAQNDTYFNPGTAQALYKSFTAAGGRAVLEQPGPFGKDGHNLFFGKGGSATWGPLVEQYIADDLSQRK